MDVKRSREKDTVTIHKRDEHNLHGLMGCDAQLAIVRAIFYDGKGEWWMEISWGGSTQLLMA